MSRREESRWLTTMDASVDVVEVIPGEVGIFLVDLK